jgi:hypothetical protein
MDTESINTKQEHRIEEFDERFGKSTKWIICSVIVITISIVGGTALAEPYRGFVAIGGTAIGLIGIIISALITFDKL